MKLLRNVFRTPMHYKTGTTGYGDATYLVAPTKRMISHSFYPYSEPTNYFLSFPYIVFNINYCLGDKPVYDPEYIGSELPFDALDVDAKKNIFFSKLSMAYAIEENFKSLYYPSLHNICYNLDVCQNRILGFSDFDNQVNEVISSFWNSSFNNSMDKKYQARTNYPSTNILSNYKAWEYKTKNDPSWIPSAELVKIPDIVLNPLQNRLHCGINAFCKVLNDN